jgi:hypothetical protein
MEAIKVEKRRSALIAILVVQVALLFAVNRFFVNDTSENIDRMRQVLILKGTPPNQVDAISDAFTEIKINISGYVLMTAMVLIGLNGTLVQLVNRKEAYQSPRDDA